MYKRKAIAACALLGLAGAVAWACGPMFPNQLLDNRQATLKAVPVNSFAFEVRQLLPATDQLKPVEADTSIYADEKKIKPDLGITDAQQAIVDKIHTIDDDVAAYAAGKDLPEDIRLYAVGASLFNRAMDSCGNTKGEGGEDGFQVDGNAADVAAADKGLNEADTNGGRARFCTDFNTTMLDKAVTYFERVLALPAGQAKSRSVWAAYMLGRIHAVRALAYAGSPTQFKQERDAAAKSFELVRTRALAGDSDTQGLGVASFGEEAQLFLYNNGKLCSWSDFYNAKDCATRMAPSDLKHAIALYSAQAGHHSDNAMRSLEQIAYAITQSPPLTRQMVDGPLSQRLLVAYVLARHSDSSVGDSPATSDSAPAAPEKDSKVATLVDAIVAAGGEPAVGADRLAALCYEAGRYDLAAKLLDKTHGPLTSWLRAKLALQKGDMAAAAAAYAEAAKAFPKADDPQANIEPSNTQLILGEQGVLALARGEYVEAMGHLFDAAVRVGGDGNQYNGEEADPDDAGTGYANDMNFVAERVLTVDELKSFVDAHAPASPAPQPKADKNAEGGGYSVIPVADSLRWLLARRLMRAGRYDEALAYFPASGDSRFGNVDLRAKAKEYAQDLHDAEHRWTDIGKAQAAYAAAAIARANGMEILGYEQNPDFTDNGGSFPGGSGQDEKSMKQTFVTDGERQRYDQSQAKPNQRFHYRYLAVDQASRAADLLPPRSQAFAAVLCKATGWMMDGPGDDYFDYNDQSPAKDKDDERTRRIGALYGRYVKQGPYVEWADDFGRGCPEPDFDAARKLKRAQQIRAIKHAIRRHWPMELGGLVVVVAGVAFALGRRRKNKPQV
ncbi:hypothetical protein [Dyella sp.]|uniref:hypothetical protein n=1 Tax=Dyella sp. TaxID=1869338 RepID=UPI002ED1D408